MDNTSAIKPIVECVRDWILTCPLIDDFNSLTVDYQEDGIDSFTIETVPCDTIVKRYVNGSSIRRYEFNISSVQAFTQEILDQISNSFFFERLSDWMENCSGDNLPQLGSSKLVQDVTAITNGYMISSDQTTARYMIQCRLTYLQDD